MIQALYEGLNHKYFRASTLGLHQFHICWLQGTQNASSYQIQKGVTEQEEPNVPCYFGLQAAWNLPGGSRGTACPSVEAKQLAGNNPEASQQLTGLSNEGLASCSPWSCPALLGSDGQR